MQQDWFETDYYEVLGVASTATAKEITRAYRQLARALHPDVNPDDPSAEDRFRKVAAAYEVVGDAATREEYDEARRRGPVDAAGQWSDGQWSGGQWSGASHGFDDIDLSDLFADMFARSASAPRRGADLDAELALSFDDAVTGTTIPLSVDLGSSVRTRQVRIPAGVRDGQRIRIRGQGGAGSSGGDDGDLYLRVLVDPHPLFGRDGDDLTITAPVAFPVVALGGEATVPTFSGTPVTIRIPEGTRGGTKLRVRGHGVTTTKGTGDLIVTVEVDVPQHLGDARRAALEQYAATDDELIAA